MFQAASASAAAILAVSATRHQRTRRAMVILECADDELGGGIRALNDQNRE
jgi:hypothetical protein